MKNLWLKYTLYRLGLFAALSVLFGVLGMPWFLAVLLGGILSFTISMFLLSNLRDEMSKQIHEKRANTLGSGDTESDFENDLIDGSLEGKRKKTPAKPKGE